TDDFNKAVCDLLTPALRDLNEKEQEWFYCELETFADRLNPKEHRPALVSLCDYSDNSAFRRRANASSASWPATITPRSAATRSARSFAALGTRTYVRTSMRS